MPVFTLAYPTDTSNLTPRQVDSEFHLTMSHISVDGTINFLVIQSKESTMVIYFLTFCIQSISKYYWMYLQNIFRISSTSTATTRNQKEPLKISLSTSTYILACGDCPIPAHCFSVSLCLCPLFCTYTFIQVTTDCYY